MSRVEIACFSEPGPAELAVEFLRRHGVAASIPAVYFPHRQGVPATRVYVKPAQAAKAVALFERVLAGEFADEDPTHSSSGGLGAALAEAILPAPGYRPPTVLEGFAPLIVIVVVVVAVVAGRAIFQFVTM